MPDTSPFFICPIGAAVLSSFFEMFTVHGMYNFGGIVVANIISKVIYLTKMSLDTLSGREVSSLSQPSL